MRRRRDPSFRERSASWFARHPVIENMESVPQPRVREVMEAALRASKYGRPPFRYVGMGATGIVLCDRKGRAYKVARHSNPGYGGSFDVAHTLLAEESDWLRTASTIPSIRLRVARFIAWHPRDGVLVRECVPHTPRYSMTKPRESLWELHQRIAEAMAPYGYGRPEYKEDSYVYARGRGWVLVDAGFAIVRGSRLMGRASRALRGENVGESKEDLAWAIGMESGETIPAHLAERMQKKLTSGDAWTRRVLRKRRWRRQ